MRIIRFVDDGGTVRYGHGFGQGTTEVLEGEFPSSLRPTGRRVRVLKRLAPVQPPAILGVGLNYHQHAVETGAEIPVHPVLFMKNPAAVIGDGEPIVIPRICAAVPQVDFEVELAVVIGRAARDVPREQAMEYVFGYTVANDVSARRWQKQGGAGQWVRGKSFDTFCPLGPHIVTTDEAPDPQNLRLLCRVNGRVMQDGCTADMIFPVAALISELSSGITLLPGTVILTGTPAGVGVARHPPVFLKPGDTVEMTIDGLGALSNPVVSEAGMPATPDATADAPPAYWGARPA